MQAQYRPDKVHLVGSIGLGSVEEVFHTVGTRLGRRVRRVPDGEVGGRRLWISWQYPLLRSNPFLRPDPSGAARPTTRFPLLCLAEDADAALIDFGELGYAREARASYLDFTAARARGELPESTRFQVCLPTPMGVIYAFCPAPDVVEIDRAYERAMIAEVERLCRGVPHADLCIQWDVCTEMVIWDGQPQDQFPVAAASKEEITQRMARICASIPEDVELGFHLCYGDFGARHFLEPMDASKLVEMANAIAETVKRPIAYMHMPVPIARSDDAYYEPLRDLALSPQTEVHLGLVHADGTDGTQKRIAAAHRYLSEFGIATECGMARARKPDLVNRLLDIHAACSDEPPATAPASTTSRRSMSR